MAFGPGPDQFRSIESELQEMRKTLLKHAAQLKEAFPKISVSLLEIAQNLHDNLGAIGEIAASLEYQDKRQQLGVGQAWPVNDS